MNHSLGCASLAEARKPRPSRSGSLKSLTALRASMTDWRAVGYGFVVQVLIGVFAFAIPGVGHAAAGLIGGFVAGYVAGGGLGNGAWHGLLAGALGGILIAVFVGAGASIIGGIGAGPLGLLGGLGVFAVAIVIALILAIDSAIAGAVGGVIG